MAKKVRVERDTMGSIDVPADRLWGAQTQRSLHHFHFPGETMPLEVVHAQVLVKKAAAAVNVTLGALDRKKGAAIIKAADEALAGKLDDHFPLVTWQTGSGTQTNMNVNEVLANRASELLGGGRGDARLAHPNDDVNLGQSSNDTFPTAMHVASVIVLERTLKPAVKRPKSSWAFTSSMESSSGLNSESRHANQAGKEPNKGELQLRLPFSAPFLQAKCKPAHN